MALDESQQKLGDMQNAGMTPGTMNWGADATVEVRTVEISVCPRCKCVPTFCMTAQSFWKLCGCGRERISREVVKKAREEAHTCEW